MKTNEVQAIGTFLCDYATTLLESGATTVRIEKNVWRMAESYGFEAEVNIYPRHVDVVQRDQETGSTAIFSKTIKGSANNYATITELSKLSWNCYDHHLSLEVCQREYQRIIHTPRLSNTLVTILTSFANLSFCRLFGGDLISMTIVFVATLCGSYVKGALHRKWGVDMRVATIVAGCISAIMSCSGYVFGWGTTPDVALATSVLYLVPGIPYLNSVSDLINGHNICATSRFLQAMIITVCLSVGLYLGLWLMNIGIL